LIAFTTRREVIRTLLSASVGGFLHASKHDSSESKTSGSTSVRPNREAVRNLILQAITHGKATGVAVAVAHRGSIAWEEGFGWANRESRVKATAHTPFSLASITKPFTATTLMTLAAEGKLSLDDSANKYLQNSRIQATTGSSDAATVRLLGAHVSGLPTMYEGYDRDEATLALSSRRTHQELWGPRVPAPILLRIQQHRFCCAGRHRVEPDGNGLWNSHDTAGSKTAWPSRQFLR
jgi:CubicO group peptidase (beta-lactamase class C family)